VARLPHFRPFTDKELGFIAHFKAGELHVDAGTTILEEGAHSAHLFTLLSGWAFRHSSIDDGRRQILNFAVPGDLVGLQASLMTEMHHSVETLTPATLCVFERDRLRELFENHPDLAFDVTWIAAREERVLDEHLLSVGRRTALERAAYLLAFLTRRAVIAGMFPLGRPAIPITQQHVADTLGLSLVHTNKTLRKLADRQLLHWGPRGCEVTDVEALADIARWSPVLEDNRPFI
jgi:CRP-like cAMP-binding protein